MILPQVSTPWPQSSSHKKEESPPLSLSLDQTRDLLCPRKCGRSDGAPFPKPSRGGLQHFLCSHAPLLPPWECTRLTLGSRATLLWPIACWLPDTPGSPAEARKTTQTKPLTHKLATYPWASDSSLQHDCGNRKLKDDPTKSRSMQQRLPHSPLRGFSWRMVSVHSSPLCPSDFSLQLFTDGLSCPCYPNTPDLTSPSNVVQIRIALGPLVIHGSWFKTISCSKLRKQYMFIARK